MTSWRRRLIRFLGWWIAAFASLVGVVLLLLAAYLLFFDYTETLRQKLQTELSRMAGAPARIGSIDLDLASFAFEMTDISVTGPESGEPMVTVERVWGRLRFSEIARLRLRWADLVVQGLSVHLVQGSEGGFRLPGHVSTSPALAGAGLALSADRVTLENAAFVVSSEKVPWQLRAVDLGVELRRELSGAYKGTVRYQEGVVELENGASLEGALSAEVELANGELFVHEARAESEVGTAFARGKMSFAGGVRGRFDVEAEGDVARVSKALLGVDDSALTGTGRFEGQLDLTPETRKLEGTVALPAGRVSGIALRDWSGELLWDAAGVEVRGAAGQLASGQARVELHQALPLSDHPASLEVDVSEASLRDILSGVQGRPSPVDSDLSGSASLSFPALRWETADGTFEFRGSQPAASEGAEEGVDFSVSGKISDGDVELEVAEIVTATSSGTVTGVYPQEGSADFLVDVTSSDLARTDELVRGLRRLFRSPDEPDPDAWGIAGRGRARGRLTDRLPHPRFEGEFTASVLGFGRLRLENVESRVVLLRGELRFEDLLAHHGDGVVAGAGVWSLEGPLGRRDFDLNLRVSQWPLVDLATLVGASVRIEGRATGDIDLRRAAGMLDGECDFDVVDPTILGETFDRAEARASFRGTTLRLDRAAVFRGAASIEGALALDLESGAVQGALAARDFPLDGAELAGLGGLEGHLDATAALAGHVDAPVVDFKATGRDLTLGGTSLGAADLKAAVDKDDVELELRLGDGLVIDATGSLRGNLPLSGELTFEDLDAGPWFARTSERFSSTTEVLLTGGGRFSAELRGAGVLGGDATLERVVVHRGRVRLESLAPVQTRYRNGILYIPTILLAEGPWRLGVGGAVNFSARKLDLAFEGIAAFDILETLHPHLAASGSMDLSARMSGNWKSPSLSGRADVDGGSLRIEGFPQALGGIKGRLVFDNRTIRIPKLEGVFGSGPVTLSGVMSLEGLEAEGIDITATGRGMRLRYPEGLVAMLDADLALLGNRSEQVLSGRVTLRDAVWSREYDLVSGILTDSEGFGLFDELENEALFENLRLDLAITAPESLRLRNSLAEIDASADLELRGTIAEPVLLGTMEAERGEVYFLGQRYDITSGKVDFVDPTRVEPFIDLTAETRVRSYRVELRLTGTTDRFHPELSSDPPLRTVDILRLLSGANERDILIGTEEEEIAGVGVASLLTERLSQELGRRAERLFGLDRFSIDPFLVGQIANPTARVSLGKQITRDLSINYSTNLNSTTEAIVLIEYTPEGNMSWILSRDEEGDVGVDVKFRKSF